jgi:hypothetical protein
MKMMLMIMMMIMMVMRVKITFNDIDDNYGAAAHNAVSDNDSMMSCL